MDALAEVMEVTRLVLGRADVEADCNLLDMGVSSLALMQIVSILEDRLDVSVPLADLVDGADLGTIARSLERQLQRSG